MASRRFVRPWIYAAALGLGTFETPAKVDAGEALRDLPPSFETGIPFVVTITLAPPPGTSIVAAEDAPPSGWIVSNISDSGTFDVQTGKVKWGLFFAPAIPTSVSYTVTPAPSPSTCFSGTASFDGADSPIGGDFCTAQIPAASSWGVAALALSILTAGTILHRRNHP